MEVQLLGEPFHQVHGLVGCEGAGGGEHADSRMSSYGGPTPILTSAAVIVIVFLITILSVAALVL